MSVPDGNNTDTHAGPQTAQPAGAAKPAGATKPQDRPGAIDALFAHKRTIGYLAVGAVAWLVGNSCYFTVGPSEMAFTTMFGRVQQPIDAPLQPGLHMKWPIAHVDPIHVSKDQLTTDAIVFFTRDGQQITLSFQLVYDIPAEAVYNLLYQTGKAGNQGWDNQMRSVIADNVRSILAKYSIIDIVGEKREEVLLLLKTTIQQRLHDLYGVHVDNVQIPTFTPSAQYLAGVERAVLMRNEQLAASLEQQKANIEAQTRLIRANAEAAASISLAEGQKRQTILAAEAEAARRELAGKAEAAALLAKVTAEAQGVVLTGQANADAYRKQVEALGGPAFYNEMLRSQAAAKWNGSVPTMVFGGSGGTGGGLIPFMNIPPPPARGSAP